MAGTIPRTTLSDIARKANVSVSTVSKVLNGHTDISEDTRGAVQRLLDDHGYQRPTSRRRRGPRGDLVELVINELDSAWALAILNGVQNVIEEAALSLVVSAVHSQGNLTSRWFDSLLQRGSQGVILVLSDLTDVQHEMLGRRRVPYVMVDPAVRPPLTIPSVSARNAAGAYAATKHLVDLGHTRIGMIGGPEHLWPTQTRISAYLSALEDAGLPRNAELIRYGNFKTDGGMAAAAELLALKDRPTAIFAGSDQQANGTYEAARRRKLRVPDDLSVVGFDDLEYSQWTTPPLTTVRQPLHEMGITATRMLLQLMSGRAPRSTRVELPTELIVRESTAPPRRP